LARSLGKTRKSGSLQEEDEEDEEQQDDLGSQQVLPTLSDEVWLKN
jgi:hypothetical protein